MRITVERDEMSQLIPRSYEPIEIEDLARLIKSSRESRDAAMLKDPVLESALYVARIENGYLSSECSRFQFDGGKSQSVFVLGSTSMALSRARSIPFGQTHLVDNLLLDQQGQLSTRLEDGPQNRWFAFSQRATDDQNYALRIPRSPLGILLVDTPAELTIQSDDVVVQSVASIESFLPEDWPNKEAVLAQTPGRSWWAILLAGVSNFQLTTSTSQPQQNQWLQRSIRSATISHTVDTATCEVKADFQLEPSLSSEPVRLQISNNLRVNTLQVDNALVNWRTLPSLGGDSRLIEIPGVGKAAATVSVSGFATLDESGKLPDVTVASSFTLSGQTMVKGAPDVVIHHIQVGPSQNPNSGALAERQNGATWEIPWIGIAPSVIAETGTPIHQWSASSFTVFSAYQDWLSARCRVRLTNEHVDSNQLKITVGDGWFVDDLSVVGTNAPRVDTEFYESGSQDEPLTDILLRWDNDVQTIATEIEVLAHRPVQDNAGRIRLFSRRPLTVEGANQTDHYALESSSRYQVETNATLLRFQLQESDLADWQQALLPQGGTARIFRGIRRTVPPVLLNSRGGNYQAQLLTTFANQSAEGSAQLRSTTWILVEPKDTGVSTIEFLAPTEWDAETAEWSVSNLAAENGSSVVPTLVSETRKGRLYRIELNEARTEDFLVRADSSLSATTEDAFAFPSLSLATESGSSAYALLPKDVVLVAEPEAQILPEATCCSGWDVETLTKAGNSGDWRFTMPVRLNTNQPRMVAFRRQPDSERAGSWVSGETIEHRMEGERARSHLMNWTVQVADDGLFVATLPDSWKIEQLLVNGEPSSFANSQDDNVVRLALAPGTSSDILLKCISEVRARAWLCREELARPSVNLSIYRSTESLRVSPDKVRLVDWLEPAVGDSSSFGRLLPNAWWRWFAPSAGLSSNAQWATVPINRALPEAAGSDFPPFRTWIIDRSAAAAISLAIVIGLTSCFWIVVRNSALVMSILAATLITSLLIIPSGGVAVVQLATLACGFAALLRMVHLVVTRPSTDNSIARSTHQSRTAATGALLFVICLPAFAFGQESNPSLGTENGIDASDELRVFGILIPVEESEVFGEFAYIHQDFRRLLSQGLQEGTTNGTSHLTAAAYRLDINDSSLVSVQPRVTLRASLRVSMGVAGALRLPYLPDEMRLEQSIVNGQFGNNSALSVTQDSTGVLLQADMPGTYSVELELVVNEIAAPPIATPNVALPEGIFTEGLLGGENNLLNAATAGGVIRNGNAGQLSVRIPELPSSTLSVASDSDIDVTIDSVGRLQGNDDRTTAQLGPRPRLIVSWEPSDERPTAPMMINVVSRLWLQADANNLVAAGMLQIENPRSLPATFHVAIDDQWEPVGSLWGDAEMTDSQSMGNRRLYSVRLSREAQERIDEPAFVRVLLAPKQNALASNSLILPFLNLQEAGQSAVREVKWSPSQETGWAPNDLNSWTLMDSEDEADWGPLKAESPSATYRIPFISVATLQKTQRPPETSLSEITRLHLGPIEASMRYHAEWPAAQPLPPILRLEVPAGGTVGRVSVNDHDAEFQLLQEGRRLLVIVRPDQSIPDLNTVDVDLVIPLRLNRQLPLGRVLLLDYSAASSIVRVERARDLLVQFSAAEGVDLELTPVAARPTDQLTNLSKVVGQVDLGNEFRDSSLLPLSFRIERSDISSAVDLIQYVRLKERVWSSEVVVRWQIPTETPDFLLFDIPTELNGKLSIDELPFQILPGGSTDRAVLAILLPDTVDQDSNFRFSFDLQEDAASSALQIPYVRLLTRQSVAPVVALPTISERQRVSWQVPDRLPEIDFEDPIRPSESARWVFYRTERPLRQAVWEFKDRSRDPPELLHSTLTITEGNPLQSHGFQDFWLLPNGEREVQLVVPEDVEVVSVMSAGRMARWNATSNGNRINVLLQPNYLALPLRVYLRWQHSDQEIAFVPNTLEIEGMRRGTSATTVLDNYWRPSSDSPPQVLPDAILGPWSVAISSSMPQVLLLEPSEQEQWLTAWHPSNFGLEDEQPMQNLETVAPILSRNPESIDTISTFWHALCDELGFPLGINPSSEVADGARPLSEALIFAVKNSQPILQHDSAASDTLSKIGLAIAVATATVLLLLAAMRLREFYLELLSRHPWLYWLMLAAFTWLLFPVGWPSLLLALVAFAMALSQFWDYRRASQFR